MCLRLFLPAAVSVPVRPGEGGDGAFPQRWRGLVSGGAQEPGLLRLREASHQDHQPEIQACLVTTFVIFLVIRRWQLRGESTLTFDPVCVLGMPAENRQRLRPQETRTLTWWSWGVSWTPPSAWTRSKISSKHLRHLDETLYCLTPRPLTHDPLDSVLCSDCSINTQI